MKKKMNYSIIIFILILIYNININHHSSFAGNIFDETTLLTIDTLQSIKPPSDFRTYFMLQSIDDTTQILIGDFVDAVKVIILIIDEGSDNIVDRVIEYYPESNKFKKKKIFSSKKFTSDIEKLKKEIIDGTVFENYYSYEMRSLPRAKKTLNEGTDIYNSEGGWVAIIYDKEKAKSSMSKFYFRLKDERYDLVFKTNYYRLYKTVIYPPISHSVYCRNSKDPIVANYVKELLKLLPQ